MSTVNPGINKQCWKDTGASKLGILDFFFNFCVSCLFGWQEAKAEDIDHAHVFLNILWKGINTLVLSDVILKRGR